MQTDFAVLPVPLVMVSEIDLDRLGTTTLGVLDDSTVFLARNGLLANRAVLHAVVKFEVGVVFQRYLHFFDGEAVLQLIAAVERSWRFLGDFILDAFAVESSLGQVIPLSKAFRAGPATAKVEVVIALGRTLGKIGPVVAALLLVTALVVVGVR
jgi:hypothetical protein